MRDELFGELKQSLNEAIEHASGKLHDLRTITRPKPPQQMSKEDIAGLRLRLNCSQGVFAAMLNVSPRTVQAWERGARTPSDAALKLLSIARKTPEVLLETV